jgi:hypothetical protein
MIAAAVSQRFLYMSAVALKDGRKGTTSVLRRCGFSELVENMEVALIGDLSDHSRLFEEVVVDVRSHGLSLRVEVDFEVFSKSRGIVVSQCLRVSERFQQRIGSQHHVLDFLNRRVASSRNTRNVLHKSLRGLSLSRSGFS